MKPLYLLIFCCCIGLTGRAQKQGQTATYFSVQYNNTLSDFTLLNNPWALGAGFQFNFLDERVLKPVLEVTSDFYLESVKILYLNPDGSVPVKPNDVRVMVNMLGGFALEPLRTVYLSTTAGASLAGGQILFAIKPAAGVYMFQRKVLAKLYYINVFNRGRVVRQNFETAGLSIGLRIF